MPFDRTSFGLQLGILAIALAGCGKVQGSSGGLPDADPCATETCQCTVATEATDCGVHEICDTTGPGRVCACAPAYAKDASGACAFAGAPLDPGLVDPSKWTASTADVSINPAAAGNVNPGEGVFTPQALCTNATLSQTFTMPPLAVADPFKLVLTHHETDANGQFPVFLGTQIEVGVLGTNGSQWKELSYQRGAYRTDTFCLGAAAYDGPTQFVLSSLASPVCANLPTDGTKNFIGIDQLQVQLADPGECPMPGSVLNGDLEAASANWKFDTFESGTGAVTAGMGENGSMGIVLSDPNKCSQATATGTISFPTHAQLANPALDLWVNGSGNFMSVLLDNYNVATINPSGQPGHVHVCVPAWAAGNVTTLGFQLPAISENGCTTAFLRQFQIDSMTLVSDPTCNVATDPIDPGFERVANVTGPQSGWGVENAYVNDVQGIFVQLLASQAAAHSGTGYLRLLWDNQCTGLNQGGASQAFLVPAPQAGAGPAVKFFANVAAANSMTVAAVTMMPTGGTPVQKTMPPTGSYQPGILCLPPVLAGRRVSFLAGLGNTNGGACATVVNTEQVEFDDFEITTDPSCPAQ